jgi:hypothetical protein
MHIGPSTIIYQINTFANCRIGTQQHKLQNCLSIKGETTKQFLSQAPEWIEKCRYLNVDIIYARLSICMRHKNPNVQRQEMELQKLLNSYQKVPSISARKFPKKIMFENYARRSWLTFPTLVPRSHTWKT